MTDFITKNLLYIAAVALLGALGFAGWNQVQVWRLEAANARHEAKIATLSAENTQLMNANADFAASAERQRSAIERMNAEAKRREDAARAALAAAEREAAQKISAADLILSQPMAKPGDECGSLEILINAKIAERQK